MRGAEHYLREHYSQKLAVDSLAQHLRCSPTYLQRTFKEVTGFTLREYQSELRLREALRLLEESDLKIEAIARHVGYRSKKDLYKLVQDRVGRTPLEFRKGRQAGRAASEAETAREASRGHGSFRHTPTIRRRREG